MDFLRLPIVCLWFPMFSFQIPRMSVWFSCEFPYGIPVNPGGFPRVVRFVFNGVLLFFDDFPRALPFPYDCTKAFL